MQDHTRRRSRKDEVVNVTRKYRQHQFRKQVCCTVQPLCSGRSRKSTQKEISSSSLSIMTRLSRADHAQGDGPMSPLVQGWLVGFGRYFDKIGPIPFVQQVGSPGYKPYTVAWPIHLQSETGPGRYASTLILTPSFTLTKFIEW